jgi:hypothetical protein
LRARAQRRYRSRVRFTFPTVKPTLMLTVAFGCASAGGLRLKEGADYGREGRAVWVRGPWELVTPSSDMDEVIDQLCPAVMRLADARGHDDGVEYCGLLYVGADGRSYASAPSRLSVEGEVAPALTKTCLVPLKLRDAGGFRAIEGDYHSHPWPDSPPSSRRDTAARNQIYSIRIQFDTTCHVYKLVPHVGEPVPAEVFVRVGRSWHLLRSIPLWDKASGNVLPPFEVP